MLAVVAPILSIRLLQMRAPPEFAPLPALLIGGYAFIRAIAMTGERRERNLFIQRILWIGGFVSMLSFILFYLWLVWALRGG